MAEIKISADAGGGWTSLKGPANTSNQNAFVLPSADGSAGQFLKTDGSKTLSFASVASSPVTALNNATANELVTVGSTTTELDAEANLTFDGSTLTVTGHIKADGGFGIMEPGFVAAMSGDEQIDHSTNHKLVNWQNYSAAYNPGWDATNDRFTVPTGGAGKYLFGWKLAIGDNHQQHLDEDEFMKVWLNINGGGIGRSETRTFGNSGNAIWQVGTVVWDLADADYIEMYAWHDEGARVDINDDYSLFWGFRMAEGD